MDVQQTHLEGASTSLQPMDAEALESGDPGSAHGLSRPSPMLTRRGDKAGQAPSPSAAAADGGPSPTSDDQHENGQEYEVAQGGDTQQGEGTAEEGNASGQAALKLKPDAFGADLDGGLDSQVLLTAIDARFEDLKVKPYHLPEAGVRRSCRLRGLLIEER